MREPSSKTNALSRAVIGAAMDVHKALGPGFLESVYEVALAMELEERDIPFQRQAQAIISYRGRHIGAGRMDFLVDNQLVLELKAVSELLPIHQAQLISYLKATGATLGLLLNFNVCRLRKGIHRVVLTQP